MRIAFLTHYTELYGANRSLLDLVLEVRSRNAVEPFIIAPREGPLLDRLREQHIPVAVFPFQPWMSERHYSGRFYHRWKQQWGYERAARQRLRDNAMLVPSIGHWIKGQGIALVHANSLAVSVGAAVAQESGLPFVQHIREMPEKHYGLHLDMGRKAYASALRSANVVIAISQAAANDARRYAPELPIAVVPNGVMPAHRYAPLAASADERWQQSRPFVFVMVGLLHPGKRYDEAVEALRLVRGQGHDARLIIAGGGRDKELLSLVERTGMAPHMDLMGFIEDPFPLFAKGHALLMCSRDEAMGRVTVEAMASGLPVIGHASGATPEVVQAGTTGLLYPGGAVPLAQRMMALIGDPGSAREMGRKGMAEARARYTVEQCAQQVLDIYRTVLSPPLRSSTEA